MDVWTERLRLRQPDESDVEPIFRACQDPDIQRFTLVPVPYTRADATGFVWMTAERAQSHTWTIRTRAGDEFVGVVGIMEREDRVAIGYWCAPGQRGRGYLGEAVAGVVDHGFGTLGLPEINWSALVGNIASARLAAGLGFRYVGRRTESVRGDDAELHTAVLQRTDRRDRQTWPVEVYATR
ncbi:GNAT family N-acetyltransferase [Gordonia sp. CPCC 205515]|uniref:GNAT family N-acetyltransferase n=1 Tax=Gordonia sp. CPCC 205515 TaxID=3140791 RepID=UPI003AF36898